MKWFNRLRGRDAAPPERRSIVGSETWLQAPSLAGVTVTPDTALSLSAVYACVNVIASSVASMPFQVFERIKGGGRREAPDHPIYDLLACEPNPESGANAFWTSYVGNAVLHGNGCAEITRGGDGTANGLHLLDSRGTRAMRSADNRLYYQAQPAINLGHGVPVTLLAEDVLHVATLGPNGIEGHSPITLAQTLIGAAMAAEVTGASVFGQGSSPVGSIEVAGELDETARKNLREYWNRVHSGPYNAGKVAILEDGAKFHPWMIDFQKLQYNETRWQAAKQIAQLFGVPPHKIGILDNATYGSLEEQDLDFYKSTLRLWCERIESEVNRKLFTRTERRKYFAEFDMNTTIRGNLSSLSDHIVKMFGVGAYTTNDACRKLGLNPIGPEGDKRFVAAQLLPLDAPAQPAKSETPPNTPEPDPAPAPSSKEAVAAVRSVVQDALSRCVTKEVGALRRAAKRPDFQEFATTFYADHEPFLASALAPSLRALSVVSGESIDPASVAADLVSFSREELREATDLEAMLASWRDDRASLLLDACDLRSGSGVPDAFFPEARAAKGGGGCGTGHGGFKAGNTCGRRGSSSSISGHPARSPLDLARDSFSDAKLDHSAARSAHKANPTPETTKNLATARESLGAARSGYASAHPGGKIVARPLDSNDPRIRKLRDDRHDDLNYGDQYPSGGKPVAVTRKSREDKVLMTKDSPLEVTHHYGEEAPKFAKSEAVEVKTVAKKLDKLKKITQDEEPIAARLEDLRASELGGESKKAYLTFDRVSGAYGSHISDYSLGLSYRNYKGLASGRIQVLKAYGKGGKEVPIDGAMLSQMKTPHPSDPNK